MPVNTALLVIDMQVFFESMTTIALPNIKLLCSHFTEANVPVMFTQHGHSKEELTTDPSPNQLVRKWGSEGSIATGSEDWKLMPELSDFHPKINATSTTGFPRVVPKNTYDAFIDTDLHQILTENGVQRVVVCGVMTDCCCDTTARSAFNRGFETWLVGDACGSANKTQHERGLKGFGLAFGEVLSTRDVLMIMDE